MITTFAASAVALGVMAAPKPEPAPAPAKPRASAMAAVGYEKFRAGNRTYHMVKVDLASSLVEADTIYARSQKPWQFVAQTQPLAAITGTFFAPQNGRPVADVLVDGKLRVRGNRGSVLGVTDDGHVVITDKGFKRKFDWSGFRSGLRGAVRLIDNGAICPNPKAQRFRDPRIWGRAERTGVGLTHRGKLVLMATKEKVTLSELGRAMVKKGVVEAVSLDGGSSTCLYYGGRMVVPTGRRLSTMFVIRESAYAQAGD